MTLTEEDKKEICTLVQVYTRDIELRKQLETLKQSMKKESEDFEKRMNGVALTVVAITAGGSCFVAGLLAGSIFF